MAMQPSVKTSSAHRSTFLRGTHQFDILGYSKLKELGVRNTVRSGDFEAGGCTWVLVCCFDVPAGPAGSNHHQQCQLASISLKLVASSDNKGVIAKASLRIDDPRPPPSGKKRCRRWPPAIWQSAEAHSYPASAAGSVPKDDGDDSDARSWKLSVPDAFRESLYVMDDRLTIHCAVHVLLQEKVQTTSRNCSVSVVPPPTIPRDLRKLLHLDESKSKPGNMPFMTDVTFILEKTTEIHAHRLVLAMRSPVFAAELFGKMKESAACARVTIDDMSASTFKAMLFFIYSDELPDSHKSKHGNNVDDLLVAADRYDLERLRLMCEKILAENLDAASVMTTLMLVHGRDRCRLLEASCIEYMASNHDVQAAVVATKEYKELKESCGPFVTDVLEKVSMRALEHAPCASSPSSKIIPQKSASAFNSSELFYGSHEFRIPDFSAMRKMCGVGDQMESGVFHIGGYDWSICVYPSGYEEEGFIGMSLEMLTPPGPGWVTAGFKIEHPRGLTPPVIRWAERLSPTCFTVTKFMDITSTKLHYVKFDGSLTIHCNVKVSKGFSYATSPTAGATTTIAPPASNIACHLEGLLVNPQHFDVKFQAQGSGEICAHELVIATRSPILHQAMISSAPDKHNVRIDDMDISTFSYVLHFIYADELPLIMGHHAGDATAVTRDLLVAADRFGLDRMKAMCENKLCEQVTAENVVNTLELADRHHCQGLKEFCLEHISQPHVLKEVVETKSFKDLKTTSPRLLEEIILKISKLSTIDS